jgi:hypothetical protein
VLVIISAALAISSASLADVPRSVSLTAVPSLPSLLLAQAETDIIETNDGKAVVGKIIDENKAGYLIKDQSGKTQLIEYSQVRSVRRGGASSPPAAPPAVAPGDSAQSALAEIDSIDAEIRRLGQDRLNYPLGGWRALAVLSAISFAGMFSMGVIFTPAAAYSPSSVFFAALGYIMAAVFVAVFVLCVALVAKNAPKNTELGDRIQLLEEKKERIMDLQRRGAELPRPVTNSVLTVSL